VSNVTNLILVPGDEDDWNDADGTRRLSQALAAFRAWCLQDTEDRFYLGFPDRRLAEGDGACGGTRAFEATAYAWAVNYLNLDVFLKAVATTDWSDPEQIQVLVRGQHDYRFRTYCLNEDRTWLVLAHPRDETYQPEPGFAFPYPVGTRLVSAGGLPLVIRSWTVRGKPLRASAECNHVVNGHYAEWIDAEGMDAKVRAAEAAGDDFLSLGKVKKGAP